MNRWYFGDTKQRVNSQLLQCKCDMSGVPQGCVLGAAIRHPQPGVCSEVTKFVNDTTLFREARMKAGCEEL